MSKNVVFVGVDVDDKAFHLTLADQRGKILQQKKCAPSAGALRKALTPIEKGAKVIVGYEACYLGFTLYRDLSKLGVKCRVIAPTSIPKSPNDRVKTDRIDSAKLAVGMAKDQIRYVAVPTADQEADRQLVRARAFLVNQRSDLKRHILNQCRILGLDYKAESGMVSYWTKKHRQWLDKALMKLPTSGKILLTSLLQSIEDLGRRIEGLEVEIEHLCEQVHYRPAVEALSCFKGISKITAMTVQTEIFDINRFESPRQLVSYMGLDIAEYSSGGHQLQFGITRMGNRRLRTALVEASQLFWSSKTPSKRKIAERMGTSAKIVSIADRCQARLYTKGHRLLAREKPRNKVKVACAREMVGFLWEALKTVA